MAGRRTGEGGRERPVVLPRDESGRERSGKHPNRSCSYFCREWERDGNSWAGIQIRYYEISGAGYDDREHVGNGRESINKRGTSTHDVTTSTNQLDTIIAIMHSLHAYSLTIIR
jgi:hypothetical protein